MIEEYFTPAIIFALGVFTLTKGTRLKKTSIWITMLICASIICLMKGSIEMILFMGLFLPLLYSTNLSDVSSKKIRHSSIQEKATAYIATLPTFGFYFLFRAKIEDRLGSAVTSNDFIYYFEILAIVLTLLAIVTYMKTRSRT